MVLLAALGKILSSTIIELMIRCIVISFEILVNISVSTNLRKLIFLITVVDIGDQCKCLGRRFIV